MLTDDYGHGPLHLLKSMDWNKAAFPVDERIHSLQWHHCQILECRFTTPRRVCDLDSRFLMSVSCRHQIMKTSRIKSYQHTRWQCAGPVVLTGMFVLCSCGCGLAGTMILFPFFCCCPRSQILIGVQLITHLWTQLCIFSSSLWRSWVMNISVYPSARRILCATTTKATGGRNGWFQFTACSPSSRDIGQELK